ncbi:hypothetical protein PRK78_007058 [Emydomyces testavorans]|uniref:Uncharacterized protein n=1 Tax=Emydomyces testavorans TaxID=2070801 RepID=A0AAF0DPJ6_9EURO|nr:hypothetical protein PRK78_007058 [Emydomyces testavorans]
MENLSGHLFLEAWMPGFTYHGEWIWSFGAMISQLLSLFFGNYHIFGLREDEQYDRGILEGIMDGVPQPTQKPYISKTTLEFEPDNKIFIFT